MTETTKSLVTHNTTNIEIIGETANQYAAQQSFNEYQSRLSRNTRRRQLADIKLFSLYLSKAGIDLSPDDLYGYPNLWQHITYGLVAGYVKWMLAESYSIGSINVRLSTVRRYCELAKEAGYMSNDQLMSINAVKGYRHKHGRNIDKEREITRVGHKKAQPIIISYDQAQLLKAQPDTAQGRRDALLMCLLLDHGLRCGEIAALSVSAINLASGTLSFYREKVDKQQNHDLTRDTLIAAMRYLETCKPDGALLMGSRKGGHMTGRMGTRAITDRVRALCEKIGVEGASAHDGRHAWATFAVRGGTDLKSLQDAGGWNSIAMPARYAESQSIANKGVILGK